MIELESGLKIRPAHATDNKLEQREIERQA